MGDDFFASDEKYGKLRIKKIYENEKCLCKCDCGRLCVKTLSSILKGSVKNCGHCIENTYVDCDDGKSVEVTTSNNMCFYIDKEDEEIVKKYKWYITVSSRGVKIVENIDGVFLYQILMPKKKGFEIDHKDLDTLNNRKSNLRYCTHQQNQINQSLQKNNTSGFTGVRYCEQREKFIARIKISQKDIINNFKQKLSNINALPNENNKSMENIKMKPEYMNPILGAYDSFHPLLIPI